MIKCFLILFFSILLVPVFVADSANAFAGGEVASGSVGGLTESEEAELKALKEAEAELAKQNYIVTVKRVIDGDTLELANGVKIQLIGVDTPELATQSGDHAHRFAKSLLQGKRVALDLNIVQDTTKSRHVDSYGRTLAYVWFYCKQPPDEYLKYLQKIGETWNPKDAIMLNALLIQCGYGNVYTGTPFKYKGEFLRCEATARALKLGFHASSGEKNKKFPSWVLIALVFLGLWFYRRYKKNEKKDTFPRIQRANSEFPDFLDTRTGYFTNHQMMTWKSQYADILNKIKEPTNQKNQIPKEESIAIFFHYFEKADALRDEFNKKFVKEELKKYSVFFDNIEGRKLDFQQRTAIVTDEDNNLVIAGAGSGKTTTIVGKIRYLLERYKVAPREILLISYTRKSAEALAERLGVEGVEPNTFHKFGMEIIASAEGKKPSIFDQAQFKQLLTEYFDSLIKNENYLRKVTDYFADFLKPPKSQFEFDSKGGYIQYLKDQNFRPYKLKEYQIKGKTTLKMEIVKSIEECKIANFLLFHGVKYEYELPYEHDTATEKVRQYKPDFTLFQDGKKVYLEHFGISRSGNVPNWFKGDAGRSASQKYRDEMEWKRETHTKFGTTLIETYSYEMNEDVLFENLAESLKAAGMILKPKTPEEKWAIIENVAKEEVNGFMDLFATFIVLMKENGYAIDDVLKRISDAQIPFFKTRDSNFVEIVRPIYERYEQYLASRNEIDFSDMIHKASRHISSGASQRKYSYIIIDEFQDISMGRYQLVKAIKESNPACKLFCVGDDWQSIYRFGGSDLSLFKTFDRYFGFTAKSRIETTYRFQNPLIALSSNFIQKNPYQDRKELRGTSQDRNTDYSIQYSDNPDETKILQFIFQKISTDKDIEVKEILILGRYGSDLARIKNKEGIFKIDRENNIVSYPINSGNSAGKILTARFLTAHKSKGLEADIVIILNCNSGKMGFPCELSDDPVLNYLLSEADSFENGEERRLFYVAMTRAKEKVYFVADKFFKSKFILELEMENGQSPNQKCPECKTGDLVLRETGTTKTGNRFRFYGCTNYSHGCDYTTTDYENENNRAWFDSFCKE